jgi:creatinine amidohydrolase
MTGPQKRRWAELHTGDFAALDPARAIAVLPVSALEQHGPHLPLGVDAWINAGILDRALALLRDDASVLVLPAQEVGKSEEHLGFAGTLSQPADLAVRLWNEIGDGVARAGLRKFLIFNSHGGNPPVMEIVARELRHRHAMLAVCANWYDLVDLSTWFDADELHHGIHGGAVETSIMLHLRPDLVDMSKAAAFGSLSQTMASDFKRLSPIGRPYFAWATQDLNPSGAVGNAAAGDAGLGAEIIAAAARGLVELFDDIERFDLEWLKAPYES